MIGRFIAGLAVAATLMAAGLSWFLLYLGQ